MHSGSRSLRSGEANLFISQLIVYHYFFRNFRYQHNQQTVRIFILICCIRDLHGCV